MTQENAVSIEGNPKHKVVSNLTETLKEAEALQGDEIPAVEATEENSSSLTGEQPTEGTEGEDEDDDAEVQAESDGKLGVDEVNKIVKARIHKVREKTRKQVEQERQEEVQFWKERAEGQKITSDFFNLPPKPQLRDYASAPDQFETDLEKWTQHKTQIDSYRYSVDSAYAQRCSEFKKVAPDFDQVITFYNSVTLPPGIEGSIKQSANGPQLAYHLAKNFKEFNRISKIADPLQVVYELAKIELQITGAVKAAPQQKPIPKPIKTVQGGSAPKATKSIQELAAAGDKNAVLEARKKAHLQSGWTSGNR